MDLLPILPSTSTVLLWEDQLLGFNSDATETNHRAALLPNVSMLAEGCAHLGPTFVCPCQEHGIALRTLNVGWCPTGAPHHGDEERDISWLGGLLLVRIVMCMLAEGAATYSSY